MPNLRTPRLPAYRLHRASGQAVVTIHGRDHYLGRHNSTASQAAYRRLIGEWLTTGRSPSPPPNEPGLTVVELSAAYARWAEEYYVKGGQPTRSLDRVKRALAWLCRDYGRTSAAEFGPLKLQQIQRELAASGRSRRYVNDLIAVIKQVFRWGVAQELVPPSVHHGLSAVPGLKAGRSPAREPRPVKPVHDEDFEATLPHLSPVLADLLRFQRLTGCRPGEAASVRPCDLDCSRSPWIYTPATHKTEHHGRTRQISVGPKAQAILAPYLRRASDAYCFSPRDSVNQHRATLRAARRSKVQPSQRRRRRAGSACRPGDRYGKDAINWGIRRACLRAGVPHWHPNQLRHTAATEVRARFGLEAAQAVLGHSRADVTQIYAERNQGLASQVAQAIG